MSADILSDPTFQHGTIEGFTSGCKGAHCPAPATCRDVHTRYQGDFAFRRAIDSGMTGEQIVQQERAAADGARRAAVSAANTRRHAAARETRTTGQQRARRVPSTDHQKAITKLVTEQGMTDREVAEALGKTREQTAAVRKYLGLPANLESNRTPATAGVLA